MALKKNNSGETPKGKLFNSYLGLVTLGFFIFLVLIFVPFIFSKTTEYGSEIKKDNYIVSRSIVDRVVREGEILRDSIVITNLNSRPLVVSILIDDILNNVIEVNSTRISISPNGVSNVEFVIKGKGIGKYSGNIKLQGDVNEVVPVNVRVVNWSSEDALFLEVGLLNQAYTLDRFIDFKIMVSKLSTSPISNVSFIYTLTDEKNNSYLLFSEKKDINNSFQDLKKVNLPKGLIEGNYKLQVVLDYNNNTITDTSQFILKKSFFDILVFGIIPMWLILLFLGLTLIIFSIIYFIRRRIRKNKKYQMQLDLSSIPKKSEDFFFLGKIAESNHFAYLEPNRLSTHTIVAGATGGGKSIAAQVFVEEALAHNIAVIVFDPTAQWSGMLRKCEDKKMISFYPKFGLKESDARAFKGNVKQVKNSRELIEISKYMTPGQIQIFSLNKLDPSEMDIFVANVIRQIFRSDPKESPDLKILVVFDEVHRLLAKFGGSGEGFLQVERACREFRKWGIGVMLISQVLSDFVGEIKANINTEVQMRTRDEGDLNRIKVKYSEDSLRSLVKSSIGTGMFVNTAYNHSNPYFISFRPILHNTRRLSDEDLEKYNKYNDIVEDLEYQIEQLEKEHVDPFDLKMELKLVKDKLMTGSFSVVEIYLEGLKPRIDKEWEKIGKKPEKKVLKLVDESEIKKSIDEAKKARAKFEADEAKKQKSEQKEEVIDPTQVKKDLEEKVVSPLIFDNGIMVSSLKELKGVLPIMDKEIFRIHVNNEKNDISEWVTKFISPELGEKLKSLNMRKDILAEIEEFGKVKAPNENSQEQKSNENPK